MNNKKVEIGLLIAALIACFGQENAQASQASNRQNRQQNISIWTAAETGDLGAVRRLIRNNRSLVHAQEYGVNDTPLHLAAEKGHYVIVKFLLENGAHVNAVNDEQDTPLSLAIRADHGRLARYLMDHWRADITVRVPNNNTMLHCAAKAGNLRLVKTLIQRGLAVNGTNNFGETPLHHAAGYSKNPELVQFLIGYGAKVNAQDRNGNTPLLYTIKPRIRRVLPHDVEDRHRAIFECLLAHGADITAANNEQQTAFGLAVSANHARAAQYLLERGA